jgi:catechol 2,3-dioxygenase-like lactoylglutathione lyase family enzyme
MTRLHHLALRTREVDRLVAFYESWLGLSVVRDTRPRSVWLGLGSDAVLMIEKAQEKEPPVPANSLELAAFAVSAERRARMRDELVRAGLLEGETQHTLYFRDPDGRRVGVSSYPLSG